MSAVGVMFDGNSPRADDEEKKLQEFGCSILCEIELDAQTNRSGALTLNLRLGVENGFRKWSTIT